ncbi:DUF4166 domain-containing protein [Legionella pneumophila]|nr:DUF4166 domain-containing protein [Legionella pneumophila]
MTDFQIDTNTLYLIYDNECPLCRSTANGLTIKKAVGKLVLINARQSHPLIQLAFDQGLNPDKGIIVFYNNHHYYAEDALHFLALLNSSSGTLNKITASLMRFRWVVMLVYPLLKLIRRTLLTIKGVNAINHHNNQPLFHYVLGSDWSKLPDLMKQRFSNKTYSSDTVVVNGVMTIKSSTWMRLIRPLLSLSGALIHKEGENIPTRVTFRTDIKSSCYWFEREFKFSPPIQFKSYMLNIKDNIMVEFMRFGLGWRTKCLVEDDKVIMQHNGYVLRIFKLLIPLPMSILLGKCHVIEKPLSADSFSMDMELTHFLFGKVYEYRGVFKVVSVSNE